VTAIAFNLIVLGINSADRIHRTISSLRYSSL
jgi:hypothetical protein